MVGNKIANEIEDISLARCAVKILSSQRKCITPALLPNVIILAVLQK
jgi:hypothetical protein